jgi:hypothetical protein
MAHLVVILGAGASRACTPRPGDPNYLPPLTADLFSERYAPILSHYPRAEAAAADIRVIVESGALVIERFLREQLRESKDEFARRRYRQIPLYLQELLVGVSRSYGRSKKWRDRRERVPVRVRACLPRVHFIAVCCKRECAALQRLSVRRSSLQLARADS